MQESCNVKRDTMLDAGKLYRIVARKALHMTNQRKKKDGQRPENQDQSQHHQGHSAFERAYASAVQYCRADIQIAHDLLQRDMYIAAQPSCRWHPANAHLPTFAQRRHSWFAHKFDTIPPTRRITQHQQVCQCFRISSRSLPCMHESW